MSVLRYVALAALVLGFAAFYFRVLVRREYRALGRLRPWVGIGQLLPTSLWAAFGWTQIPPGWPVTDVPNPVRIVGWSLLWGGLVLTLLAMGQLGWATSFGLRPAHAKVSGFHRWSRNPQTTAFFAFLLGHALLWPTWRYVGVLMLCVAIAHMMVRTEEEHLERSGGDAYRAYRRSVRRYL